VHVPTHQQTAIRKLEGEALAASRRRADLCRRDPARFAALVRRSDWYEQQGWPTDRAIEQATADYGV
jgi:hypothetical protein